MSGAVALLALVALAGAQDAAPRLERTGRLAPDVALSEFAVAARADGAGELLVLFGEDGSVRCWSGGAGDAFADAPVGELVLADPDRALVALGRLGAGEDAAPTELVHLGPAGLVRHVQGPDGAFVVEGERLARRARFGLRTGAPTLAPVLEDVNRDGRVDLVLPGLERCEVWLDRTGTGEGGDAPGAVRFERTASVRVRSSVEVRRDDEALSDRLESRLSIPRLATRDVDGDGRPDLVVEDGARVGFHLQRADGSLPEEPDVAVDLAIFRDPGARDESSFGFGRTLTVGGRATLTSRDLDGDGRLDFVIAHGRKVWVFHGGEGGPQFSEPSTILKTAEDVTGVLTMNLDEGDALPDLLIVRVVVPTIPSLIFGLFSEWDVVVRLAGYRNTGRRRFSTDPDWQVEARLRLPPIFDLVSDPFALVQRFDEASRGFRRSVDGHFTSAGSDDLALLSSDRKRLDLWRGLDGAQARLDRDGIEALTRRELFGPGDTVWTVDRLLAFVGDRVADRQRRLTSGREADASIELEPGPGWRLDALLAIDLDGDGRDALLVVWDRPDGTTFDVLRAR